MNFKLPKNPKPVKSQIRFHKKIPSQDFIKGLWAYTALLWWISSAPCGIPFLVDIYFELFTLANCSINRKFYERLLKVVKSCDIENWRF